MTASLLYTAMIAMCLCMPAPQSNTVGAASDISKAGSGMPRLYQKWLDQDVRWIITPDERTDFLRLSNNEDRDHFVEQFWLRRDPTPNTAENEFKEEHYRRIAYANVHFAWRAVPGWETDRGRIYIVFGEPATIESGDATSESSKPTALWHYRTVVPKYGNNLKFVDVCGCGDYRLESPARD